MMHSSCKSFPCTFHGRQQCLHAISFSTRRKNVYSFCGQVPHPFENYHLLIKVVVLNFDSFFSLFEVRILGFGFFFQCIDVACMIFVGLIGCRDDVFLELVPKSWQISLLEDLFLEFRIIEDANVISGLHLFDNIISW